jgi:dihydrofolate reductase
MPRRIIGAAFLSLDGIMQAPGGPEEDRSGGFALGGWLAGAADEELDGMIGELFSRPFDLLLGRRTYDIFAAHWPYVPDGNPIAETFALVSKYVLTRADNPLAWAGSQRLSGIDALAELKAGSGPDLVIQGSSTLYPQLLRRGLLDELQLIIAPVLLGSGKTLFGTGFGTGTPPVSLRMTGHQISRTGIILARYEPAGKPETGTFQELPPSAAELARRASIEDGTW